MTQSGMMLPGTHPAEPGGLVMMVLTAIALWLCWLLLEPFIAPLTWALTLAVVAAPMYRWICRRSRHPNAAAGIAVVLVMMVIVAPAFLVSQHLVRETTNTVQTIQEQGALANVWTSTRERHPWFQAATNWLSTIDPAEQIQQAAGGLAKQISSIVTASLWVATQLLITLFILFFFFRDRHQALRLIERVTPLTHEEVTRLAQQVAQTIHATVYGTLLVAAVQGILGGLMFWWLGLPAPLLWGVVMALLAVVPVLGAFVVWIPAALWLALDGHWVKALILTGWGTFVVGMIDNLLYPIFVGARLNFHSVVMFIALVGGLIVFGAAGLILGPVILAVTDALITIWRERGRAAFRSLRNEGRGL
jgi:predicted PurR-regulated permease PerM